MRVSRRDVLLGLGGLVAGVAVTTGGVATLVYRRLNQRAQAVSVTRASDDGWLISEAERDEIASADALATSDILDIRDAVDIPGGDYRSMRVSGLRECIESCEADPDCEAFTYARASHPLPEKQRMCWIKGQGTRPPVTNTSAYVSGRRGEW